MTPADAITISAVIPTPGKGRPLSRLLRSIAAQALISGDEVLIVGDTHDGPLPDVEATVAGFASEGLPVRYLPHDAGAHGWGHPQINAGIEAAAGDYLTFNDDDDVYAPDAFSAIREAASELAEPRPLLFRFVSYMGVTYWTDKGRVEQDFIGGHCAVFPNLPERLGKWGDHYQGDFTFIRDSLDLWPNKVEDAVWVDQVIAIARPGDTP